jgi:hypothetical protein
MPAVTREASCLKYKAAKASGGSKFGMLLGDFGKRNER